MARALARYQERLLGYAPKAVQDAVPALTWQRRLTNPLLRVAATRVLLPAMDLLLMPAPLRQTAEPLGVWRHTPKLQSGAWRGAILGDVLTGLGREIERVSDALEATMPTRHVVSLALYGPVPRDREVFELARDLYRAHGRAGTVESVAAPEDPQVVVAQIRS
ncbi:hypothetical protein ACIBH1_12000 [Nonomuraea sp. NPDC050663]|uniref:hypothetical protein n=1 Tax=Nonomuraea sp. NPDC050663 TaxID=3364370 RepID=UPI0037B676C1